MARIHYRDQKKNYMPIKILCSRKFGDWENLFREIFRAIRKFKNSYWSHSLPYLKIKKENFVAPNLSFMKAFLRNLKFYKIYLTLLDTSSLIPFPSRSTKILKVSRMCFFLWRWIKWKWTKNDMSTAEEDPGHSEIYRMLWSEGFTFIQNTMKNVTVKSEKN